VNDPAIVRQRGESRDQRRVQPVELIAIRVQRRLLQPVFQPDPLKRRALEQRARRIAVAVVQLRWRPTAIGIAIRHIEARAERWVTLAPAFAQRVPRDFGDAQRDEYLLIGAGAGGDLQAHRPYVLNRRPEIAVNLVRREPVAGILAPVRPTNVSVVAKAEAVGKALPVRPGRDRHAHHAGASSASVRLSPSWPKPPRMIVLRRGGWSACTAARGAMGVASPVTAHREYSVLPISTSDTLADRISGMKAPSGTALF
jgi:hypothetical protein